MGSLVGVRILKLAFGDIIRVLDGLTMMNYTFTKPAIAALATLISALLVVCVVTHRRKQQQDTVAPTGISPEPFDGVRWRSGSSIRRIAMAHYLVRNDSLLNKSRNELRDLLGPPTGSDTDAQDEWFLGKRESGGSMMFPYSDYLVVQFGPEQRSIKAIIRSSDTP